MPQADVVPRAMVIGAGISGMQAALDIAEAGHEVVLVEAQPYIGGNMARLSETFPTLDCASCILTPRTAEVGRHPRIRLLANSRVERVEGSAGDFRVTVRKKATYVDWDRCTGCGDCVSRCPVKVPSEFERGLGEKKAVSIPFAQAVPYRPTIDPDHCLYITRERCGLCARVCQVEAIDYSQEDQLLTENVGSVVIATGYDLLGLDQLGEYGYGEIPDVIDSLAFERLNSASGPTQGEIRRPSDGKVPEEVVFIQCAGSRDAEKGVPYCSRICCMYTAKHAHLFMHRHPEAQAYIFFMDVRAGGKGYEEFVKRVTDDGAIYLRGRVSRVYQEGDRVLVEGVDTLSQKAISIAADLVVLATAVVPPSGSQDLFDSLRIETDGHGFVTEEHLKMRPARTSVEGIFVTGCARGPMDIPDAVADAGAAAAQALRVLRQDSAVPTAGGEG